MNSLNDSIYSALNDRSNSYQYLMHEVRWKDHYDQTFANGDSIYELLKQDAELAELRSKLWERIYQIAQKVCTPKQKEVLKLTVEGWSQKDIGKKTGGNQTSIHKCIYGNLIYDGTGNPPKTYGGLVRKLQLAIQDDPTVQEIRLQIQQLHQED